MALAAATLGLLMACPPAGSAFVVLDGMLMLAQPLTEGPPAPSLDRATMLTKLRALTGIPVSMDLKGRTGRGESRSDV